MKILFVCLGNICRSPAAEGVLRHMIAQDASLSHITVQSCGLGDWHIGHLPDSRMRESAELRGIQLNSRAQRFKQDFFDEYDYILAADHEVLHTLQHHAKEPAHKVKIHLITAFSASYKDQEIPDPYYRGTGAFELVLDMLEDSCEGLLRELREQA